MRSGILVMGLNGCGKTTVGRALSEAMHFRRMDVEDYYFPDQTTPYAVSRTREEVTRMLIADIQAYPNFVLSSVGCDWGSEITGALRLAVLLYAPVQIRMARIEQREQRRFGARILPGGDMYLSQQQFHAMAAARQHGPLEEQAARLECPVLKIDALRPIGEIVRQIYAYYMRL